MCAAPLLLAQEKPPAAADKPPAPRYVVNYPAAERFCPPVRSYFEDVTRTVQQSGYHTFRHQLNGGYGLPIRAKVAGLNVLHLGADVGWYHAGDPVFAMASGVVRVSEGPSKAETDKKPASAQRPSGRGGSPQATSTPTALQWGNLIAIEHRLADGTYITSIYGHLAGERLVSVGDVVQAGKIIGQIGKTGAENGGYKPHLHFAILEGRMAEPGKELFRAQVDGRQAPVMLVSLDEQQIEVKSEVELAAVGHDQRRRTDVRHDRARRQALASGRFSAGRASARLSDRGLWPKHQGLARSDAVPSRCGGRRQPGAV